MNVSDLMKWLAFYGNLYCGVCGRFRRGWVDWWTFQLADRSFPRKFHEGALTILTSDLQPVQESAHLVGDALNALQPEALLNGGYGYNACWNISGGSGRCIYKYINYKYIYIYTPSWWYCRKALSLSPHKLYLFWVRVNDWHVIHPTKETLTFSCWIYWMWR